MKLREIVVEPAITPQLAATDRDATIAELVDRLVETDAIAAGDRDEVVRAVLEREKKGSTGFGRGVAVPHVKHRSINKIMAAVGVSATGIDFDALDKQPVYTVFLLLSPEDHAEEHLQAMEVIFRNLSKETFRRLLRQATTREDVVELLDEADGSTLAS